MVVSALATPARPIKAAAVMAIIFIVVLPRSWLFVQIVVTGDARGSDGNWSCRPRATCVAGYASNGALTALRRDGPFDVPIKCTKGIVQDPHRALEVRQACRLLLESRIAVRERAARAATRFPLRA